MSVKERGFAHIIKDLGGTKRSWESAPPWVSDGSAYVPYIYSRDEAKKCYRIQVGLIGAVIYDTGVVEYYNPELTEVRVKGEEWEVWQGTKKATLVAPITWGVVEDSTGVYVTREQETTKPDGTLKVVYAFRVGKKLKQTVTWVSSETNSVTVSVKQGHLLDFDKVTTDTGVSTSSKSEKSTQYKFGYGSKDFWFLMDQSDMVYDTESLTPNTLLTEKCLQTGEIDFSGKKVSYTFGDWTLLNGETLTIDPSPATLNDPTSDGLIWDSGAGRDTADTSHYMGQLGPSIYRCFIQWDTTSIPDTATITDTVFKYHGQRNAGDCHIHDIHEKPTTATDAHLWADMGDGTAYADVAGFPVVGTNKSIDLGATADTDLKNLLASNWFAIGIVADGAFYYSQIYSEEYASTPDPTLYVEYTEAGGAVNPQGSGVVNSMLALLGKMIE